MRLYTSDIIQGYQQQADNTLSSLGVDLVEFYGFLQEEHPALLKETISQHYRSKDPSVWKELVPMYRRSVMPSEDALRRAGIPVKKAGNETIVTVKGMAMSLKAAVTAGLL